MNTLTLEKQTYCPCCDRIIMPGDLPCHPKTSLSPITKETIVLKFASAPAWTLYLQAETVPPCLPGLQSALDAMLSRPRWGQENAQKAFDAVVNATCLSALCRRMGALIADREHAKKYRYYSPCIERNNEINELRRRIKSAEENQ